MSRLAMALIAYLALGALAFATLTDYRVRTLTLLILGLFAFKTWIRTWMASGIDFAESWRPSADSQVL
jgi:hypothetical protein